MSTNGIVRRAKMLMVEFCKRRLYVKKIAYGVSLIVLLILCISGCSSGSKETEAVMEETEKIVAETKEETETAIKETEGVIHETQQIETELGTSHEHTLSGWIIDREATTTEGGKKHKECTVCKEIVLEEEIAVLSSAGLAYKVNDDGTSCTVTGIGNCTDAHVIIPMKIDGYDVFAIADNAFGDCESFTEVTIPASVKNIGKNVFRGASKLHTIYYNSSHEIYSFPDDFEDEFTPLFAEPNITKVVFGGEHIPIGILYTCSNVTQVELTNSVKSIGAVAFGACDGLTNIEIPTAVTSIDYGAFWICSGLKNITIPDSVTTIGNEVFAGCSGLTDIVLSKSITSIGEETFFGCTKLKCISIPEGVTNIGESAFEGCSSLTNVILPNSLISIDEWAFHHCSSLKDITLPNTVTKIGEGVFHGCEGLTSIIVPDSITNISQYVFRNCLSLESVVLPKTLESIEEGAFIFCENLRRIVIPSSVKSIGRLAFLSNERQEVIFEGTKSQWEAIEFVKGFEWRPAIVHCVDGDIAFN